MNIEELQNKAKQGDKESLKELMNKAKQGNLELRIVLKELFDYYSVKEEYILAYLCITVLSEQDPEAKCVLGIMYFYGIGTEIDYAKAFKCFQQAGEKSIANAIYMKGLCYLNGSGVEKNIDLAINSFSEAAEKGNYDAQMKLAFMYEHGYIVGEDIKKAYEFYIKAYESNKDPKSASIDAECVAYVALMDEDKPNCNMAKFYYQISYDLGLERNQYNLDILNKLNGREIVRIDNTAELNIEDIDKKKLGAVFIKPKINHHFDNNTLYSVEDYIKCKKTINFILEDVNKVSESRDNELDVFMQIYVKLGQMIKYDCEAYEINYDKDEKGYKERNLIGGLLRRKNCMCRIR